MLMVSATGDFDKPADAKKLFSRTLQTMGTGQRLNVSESIDRILSGFENDMVSIAEENECNGMPIRPGKRMEAYEMAVRPLLNAAADIQGALDLRRGNNAHDFTVELSSEKTESIDLHSLDERILHSVNAWAEIVMTDEHEDMSDPALPLAYNAAVRTDPEAYIYRNTSFLTQDRNGTWAPLPFLANSKALQQAAAIQDRLSEEQLVINPA